MLACIVPAHTFHVPGFVSIRFKLREGLPNESNFQSGIFVTAIALALLACEVTVNDADVEVPFCHVLAYPV
jgi:hypothetical protein